MSSFKEARERIPSQTEKIIEILKEAGEEGVTNAQLNEICFQYCARLSDLARKGYKIDCERIEKGLYKYILKKVPSKWTTYKSANEELFEAIEKIYHGTITTDQLKRLLDAKYFQIKRRPNWYKQKMMIN